MDDSLSRVTDLLIASQNRVAELEELVLQGGLGLNEKQANIVQLETRVEALEARISMERAAMLGVLETIRDLKSLVRKFLLASFDESGDVDLRESMEKLADMCGLERTNQRGKVES